MTQVSITDRLGHDTKFPIQGNFSPIAGLDLLLQDIQQLLLTAPGERVYRPTWGCGLKSMIWENIEDVAINGGHSIKTALANYEPRIKVISVDNEVNRNSGLVLFSIKFLVLSTDTSVNLVFPFRVGTELSQK